MSPVRTFQKMVGPVCFTAERKRYVELTRRGLNNAEICRILGIARKTGSGWRNGYIRCHPVTGAVTRYPPIVEMRVATASARYLSEDVRVRIGDLVRTGAGVRQIAAELGRSPSTISRELRRNSGITGRYRPFHAHRLARNRRVRACPGKIASNPALRLRIQELMQRRWSPGQISQHLRAEHPDDPSMCVVHETIYRDLYDRRGGALNREYCRMLRTKRNRRKPTRLIPRRRTRFGGTTLMIHERPFDLTDRTIPGHWEGDLIMGRHNRSAFGALVERASRSVTWDQGWEMSKHAEVTAATGASVYFCDPHSPWQRGSNENTNELLRDYFPKGSDLNAHTPRRLAVAAELNSRPRRVLGWDTPNRSR